MTEQHVRNSLKLILRYAHEGRVWALSPKTGGLRHYKKEDIVAKVTVVKEVPPPVDPWAHIQSVTLTLDVEEIKALRDLVGSVGGASVGRKATTQIWDALNAAGIPLQSDQQLIGNPSLEFRR